MPGPNVLVLVLAQVAQLLTAAKRQEAHDSQGAAGARHEGTVPGEAIPHYPGRGAGPTACPTHRLKHSTVCRDYPRSARAPP